MSQFSRSFMMSPCDQASRRFIGSRVRSIRTGVSGFLAVPEPEKALVELISNVKTPVIMLRTRKDSRSVFVVGEVRENGVRTMRWGADYDTEASYDIPVFIAVNAGYTALVFSDRGDDVLTDVVPQELLRKRVESLARKAHWLWQRPPSVGESATRRRGRILEWNQKYLWTNDAEDLWVEA